MKNYYRVMLGRKSIHAAQAFAGNFIGVDFEIPLDLTNELSEDWRAFNSKFVPVFMASHPEKTKIGAGLACGALWTVSKGIQKGSIVLCPDGSGTYYVGELRGRSHGQLLLRSGTRIAPSTRCEVVPTNHSAGGHE